MSRSCHSRRRSCRIDARAGWVALAIVTVAWCVGHALIAPQTAHAATTPAIQSGSAYPPSFVPAWDGESDSSAIRFRLVQRSIVTIIVVDQRGALVRTLQRNVLMSPGEHVTWWDGLGERGRELPYGSYRVRVRATPVGATETEPGTPASGTEVVTGSQDVPVALAMPNVAIAKLLLSRGYLSRTTAARTINVRFSMIGRGPVSAAIVDRNGRVVRNLLRGTIAAGAHAVAWTGVNDAGRAAADGSYELVIASRRGALPSRTLRAPIIVDRTPPRLRVIRVVRARVVNGRVIIPLTVRMAENATVVANVGKRTATWKLAAREYRLNLVGSRVGIVPARTARRYAVIVSALDAYGNVVRARVVVSVPATAPVRRPAPPARPDPSTSTKPDTPGPTHSNFIWPVHGPITSGFGARDDCSGVCSSFHRGIDIGVADGTRVVAARAGVVRLAGWNGGYGNYVEIAHNDTFSTGYGHLSQILVPSGTFVQQGQVIALSGHTGAATGPHVHFNMIVDGILVDPARWVPGRP